MSAILVGVLLAIAHVGHGMQFDQVTCERFQLENGVVTPAQPHGYLNGETVNVTCNAGYMLIGKSEMTCNDDYGGWDQNRPQCVAHIVQCDYPVIQDGRLSRMSTTGDTEEMETLEAGAIIHPNTVILFGCGESSDMVLEDVPQVKGYTHSVTCLSDGEWGGPVPTCKYVMCESFQLANGNVIPAQPDGYYDGDDITMMCNTGYRLSGKSQLTCSIAADGWDEVLPTCEQVKCETPDFTNGFMYEMSNDGQQLLLTKTSIIPSNTDVYFQCQAAHRMRSGGILQGNEYEHRVLCQLNGEWAGKMPTCESAACEMIAVPNGRMTPAVDAGYFNGETVNVTCEAGYKLAGKGQITCGASDWYNQPGECIELKAPNCPKPQFDFGQMSKIYQDGENTLTHVVKPDHVIHAGDVVEFRCSFGYMMSVEDDTHMQDMVYKARCQKEGTWDRSLPRCQLFECSTPPTTPNLQYTLEGQKVHYRCVNNNYELLGPETLNCRMDIKSWFPHLPTCRRTACPTVRWPENGLLVRQGRLQNATITAECNDAFTLNGTAHRTCLTNGSWSGEPAVCSSANSDCPNPGIPDGGLRSGNEFHIGARVTFSCPMHFLLLGEAKQKCLPTGKWSAPAVKCLSPDEYSDPINAVNRWVDIINKIKRDNAERPGKQHVFFLMDSSGSIRTSEINAQRNFIGNVAHLLPRTKMSWVAFNTTAFLLAEGQNTSGFHTALEQQRLNSAGASNVRRAFRTVKEVLVRAKQVNTTKASIILLLNDHINEGGSLSNAMRMRWAQIVKPDLYLVAIGGYLNRQDLVRAVSTYQPHSHHNAFFLKHKGDLNSLTTGIKTALNP